VSEKKTGLPPKGFTIGNGRSGLEEGFSRLRARWVSGFGLQLICNLHLTSAAKAAHCKGGYAALKRCSTQKRLISASIGRKAVMQRLKRCSAQKRLIPPV